MAPPAGTRRRLSGVRGRFRGAPAWGGGAGPILPLVGGAPDPGHALLERHVCIDTTASGGNAQLLVEAN